MAYSDEMEAIEQERFDADMESALLHEAGNRSARAHRRMMALRESNPDAAAGECMHGWGYPLASPAAMHESDPRKGQSGWRCLSCGSVLSGDPFRGAVVVKVACELPPRN